MQKCSACLVVACVFAASLAWGQAQPAEATKPPAESKKSAAKKAPPKPAAPKKAEGKKAEVNKVAPGVTVYKGTPPPTLKDKDGKAIPTSPDAYDVSSALPPKKK